jgi:hypothetical protein
MFKKSFRGSLASVGFCLNIKGKLAGELEAGEAVYPRME